MSDSSEMTWAEPVPIQVVNRVLTEIDAVMAGMAIAAAECEDEEIDPWNGLEFWAGSSADNECRELMEIEDDHDCADEQCVFEITSVPRLRDWAEIESGNAADYTGGSYDGPRWPWLTG